MLIIDGQERDLRSEPRRIGKATDAVVACSRPLCAFDVLTLPREVWPGILATVNAQDLWAEALAMARPAVRLSSIPTGAPPVGCFRGPPLAGVTLPGRHWLSFDCRCLPADLSHSSLRGTGTLHEWLIDDDLPSRFAVIPGHVDFAARPAAREEVVTYEELIRAGKQGRFLEWLDLDTKCVPLYASPYQSLPYVSDLLIFGSPAIHTWLRSLGWDPAWRHNNNFDKRSPVAADYERLWWDYAYGYGPEEDPPLAWSLPKGRTFAILGGWPDLLIDDPLPSGRLVLTVFADGEPRRHVVLCENGRFEVLDVVT
jgi:hypothetical protein